MSDTSAREAVTLTCLLAAIAIIGGVVFGRCTADRQWDHSPRPEVTVSPAR